MNIVTMPDHHAKQCGQRVAIHHGKQQITFMQLHEQSCKGSCYLRQLGLKPGDVVLVFVPMSIDLYCILISLWRLGATAMFLDPAAGSKTIQKCCNMAHPKAFIGTFKAQAMRLFTPAIRRIPICITTDRLPFINRWSKRIRFSKANHVEKCAADTPALITFTSGSTGTPKGTVRTHGFLSAQKQVLEKVLHLVPGTSDFATLPVFALINLACAVTTIIADVSLKKPAKVDAGSILKDFQRHGPATCVASPAFFQRLLNDPDRNNLSCLKALYTGGAPVWPQLLKTLSKQLPATKIVAVYGSTEAEPIAELCFSDIQETDFEKMAQGQGLLAGKPVEQIQCKIIENHWGTPLGPLTEQNFQKLIKQGNLPGEIVVYGDHVLKGYLQGIGDDENKFAVGQNIWHRTGDLGYFDRTGRLWLLGRCSAQINDEKGIAYPFAIETAVRQHKQIKNAALCKLGSQRILVVETQAPFPEKTLEHLVSGFHIDRILIQKIPMDKRHNAKVNYPELLKLIQKG